MYANHVFEEIEIVKPVRDDLCREHVADRPFMSSFCFGKAD